MQRPELKLALFAICTAGLRAQTVVSTRAGLITTVQGVAYLADQRLEPGNRLEIQMKDHQILHTEKGRIELVLAPDLRLRLDQNSTIRIDDTRLDSIDATLVQGVAIVNTTVSGQKGLDASLWSGAVQPPSRSTSGPSLKPWFVPFHVRLGETVVEVKARGTYRFDAGRGQVWVYSGKIAIQSGNKAITVTDSKTIELRNKTVSKFNPIGESSPRVWAEPFGSAFSCVSGEVYLDEVPIHLPAGTDLKMEQLRMGGGQSLRTGRGSAELSVDAARVRLAPNTTVRFAEEEITVEKGALVSGLGYGTTDAPPLHFRIGDASIKFHGLAALIQLESPLEIVRVYSGEALVHFHDTTTKVEKNNTVSLSETFSDKGLNVQKFDARQLPPLYFFPFERPDPRFARGSTGGIMEGPGAVTTGVPMNVPVPMTVGQRLDAPSIHPSACGPTN